jgi:enoyl-CoA hydratase/carnithine racemase
MIRLRDMPVPTIAKVSGPVLAAGLQLMASCDIVIASSCSTFSTPGINWSVSCLTPIVAVSRSANTKASAFMLLTGKAVTAEQAVAAGLITAHYPKDQLDEKTGEVVQSLLEKSRPILALGKEFFYQQLDMSLEEAYRHGCPAMSRNIQHPDAQKGIDAFVNKKKPVWTHDPWKQ